MQSTIARVALDAGIPSEDLTDVLVSCAFDGLRLYERTGDVSHLNTAIECGRGSVNVRSRGTDMALHGRLHNLGGMLLRRHERTGSMRDLIEAITVAREALAYTTEDGWDRGMSLDLLGTLFEKHYDRTGNMISLAEAAGKAKQAVEMMPHDHQGLPICLGNLGTKLRKLFVRTRSGTYLDESIRVARQALALLPPRSPSRPAYLNGLGLNLKARFELHSRVEDLAQAILAVREGVDSTGAGNPERLHCLNTLAQLLGCWFDRTGDVADMNESVNVARELVESAPLDHPNRPTYLDTLGTKLARRYEQTGNMADLDESVELVEQAVGLAADEHPDKVIWVNNLGNILYDRYRQTNQMADLQEAIRLARLAVTLTSDDHVSRPDSLNNLAVKLEERYMRTRQLVDLEEAITLTRETVGLTPSGHNDYATWQNNLGNKLEMRFKHTGEIADLNEAIRSARAAVAGTPEDHSTRGGNLGNLASKIYSRYKHSYRMDDLEEAMVLAEEALRVTSSDHPWLPARFVQLADVLEERYQRGRQIADLAGAASCLHQAWQCRTAVPVFRIHAASRCVRLFALNPNSTGIAILVGKQVIDFLPAVNTKSLDRNDEQVVMSTFWGIAADLCSLLLAANRPVEALEYLEKGRAVIIGKLVDARSDLTTLLAQRPDVARRYQTLRDQVNAPALPEGGMEASPLSMRAVERRRQAVAELDTCVLEIRQMPGQERFLLGQTAAEMQSCASGGVIVFINVTSISSDAILVSSTEISTLALPRLLPRDATAWLGKKWMGPGVKRRERAAKNREYLNYLAWLWEVCVEQVVNRVCSTIVSPSSDKGPLPRVWWIGSGLAASMPFHAAGVHTPGSTENAYSHVISSYSPSIKALAHAQRREKVATTTSASTNSTEAAQGSLLVVTMPSTPPNTTNHSPGNLEKVGEEQAHIAATVNGRMEVQHLDLPSVADVVGKLPSCTIAHFACHGSTDRADPSRSGLILQKRVHVASRDHALGDGEGEEEVIQDRLTVQQISELNLQTARIAYLSACSTAQNEGEWLTDEVLHVVSGFQVAGFPHVVGCLWSSVDHICVRIASEFYRLLLQTTGDRNAGWGGDEVAKAVQAAVMALREEYFDMPLYWAQFVHYGA